MNNEKVLIAFLEGRNAKTPTRNIAAQYHYYKGNTLTTNGTTLINYTTQIAYKIDNKLMLNRSKYSPTTSKIQTQLARLALNYYTKENIIEYFE